jgi:hypothetical protein
MTRSNAERLREQMPATGPGGAGDDDRAGRTRASFRMAVPARGA